MRFIPYCKTVHFHDRVLHGPLFLSFSAGDGAAGFALHPGMEIECGAPEPAPSPGTLVDASTITPRQRGAFATLSADWWRSPFVFKGCYDQIVHSVEAHIMLDPKPDIKSVLCCLSEIVSNHADGLAERQQLGRAVSLIHWAECGPESTIDVGLSSSGPWLSRNDINAALTTHQSKNRGLSVRLAARICHELSNSGAATFSFDATDKAVAKFQLEFKRCWPRGFELRKPEVSFPLVHLAGHPFTNAQVRAQSSRHRECSDYFNDPTQFAPLVQLWSNMQQARSKKGSSIAAKQKRVPKALSPTHAP